jgi:hypothetical protein
MMADYAVVLKATNVSHLAADTGFDTSQREYHTLERCKYV